MKVPYCIRKILDTDWPVPFVQLTANWIREEVEVRFDMTGVKGAQDRVANLRIPCLYSMDKAFIDDNVASALKQLKDHIGDQRQVQANRIVERVKTLSDANGVTPVEELRRIIHEELGL